MRKYLLLLLIAISIPFIISCSDDEGEVDPTPTNFQVSISALSTTIVENGGSVNLTITLDEVNDGEEISFDLNLSGSATQNEDYELSGTTSIANGVQSTTVTITSINDEDIEGDENIVVRISENLDNVNIQNGMVTLTIADDDEESDNGTTTFQLSLSTSADSFSEDGGSVNLTITLDKVNTGNTIPFNLEFSGQATRDEDYEVSGNNAITNGSQSTTFTVSSINDNEVEGDESITIRLLENLDNVTTQNTMVSLTIFDDDMTQNGTCEGTADTHSIDLDPSNCTVDIESVLGINSIYEEEVSGNNRIIQTNSIPNHNVGQFPNMGNPNSIAAISSTYAISNSPTPNNSVTLLTTSNGSPLFRFGVLYNGILLAPIAAEFFTNTQTGEDNTDWNENALSSEINLGTDCNNSHVFPSGMYHHHATPSAFIATMDIDGSTPVQIGWAADGYPIYYKYGNKNGSVVELTSSFQLKTEERGGDDTSAPSGCPDGTYTQDYEFSESLGDLDECNGYQDPQLGYIYVITDTFPSIPRCFTATPSDDFRNN